LFFAVEEKFAHGIKIAGEPECAGGAATMKGFMVIVFFHTDENRIVLQFRKILQHNCHTNETGCPL